jgi:hypothetical protein
MKNKLTITYKEIGNLTNKTEQAIKQMKSQNPEQHEVMKIGAFCKKYELSYFDLELLVNFKKELEEETKKPKGF